MAVSRAIGSVPDGMAAMLTQLALLAPGVPLAAASAPAGGSCAGHCGKWAGDCWCNEQCEPDMPSEIGRLETPICP